MKRLLIDEFKDKKVLIWGMGREGKSTYQVIRSLLPMQELYICDQNYHDDSLQHVIYVDQETLCFDDYDLIMKAPGIVCEYNDNISGQTNLFVKYFKKQIIGITGTKGKSTTSSLIYHLLSKQYDNVYLVGNIGKPCFDILDDMNEDSIIVFELGCHQLEFIKDSCHIAILLNIYEEHLDHYHTFERYYDTKINAIRYQSEDDIALINSDINYKSKGRIYLLNEDIYAHNNVLHFNDKQLVVENTKLIGEHNYYNMAIAYAIASMYNVSDENIIEGFASFKTLPHRLEAFLKVDKVTYVDDAIATINEACIQGITSLKDVSTVLIGGLDRGIDYTDLETFLKNSDVENVILMYDTGKRIYEELDGQSNPSKYHLVNDLKEATLLAIELTKEGICLLSPAAASYDHFKNFEQKGETFKSYVREHYGI